MSKGDKKIFGAEKRERAKEGLYLNLEEITFDIEQSIASRNFIEFLWRMGDYMAVRRLILPDEEYDTRTNEYELRIQRTLRGAGVNF